MPSPSGGPIRTLDRAGETILHVTAQAGVAGELRGLRTTRTAVGMPLCGGRAILEATTSGRGVATQLSRDRRRRATALSRDLPHATAASTRERDLLTLGEGQVTPRQRGHGD